MTRAAYLIGVSCTRFGKLADRSFKDLTREAYDAVLADAGLEDGSGLGIAWFSNCGRLRGEDGERQVAGARVRLAENGGGVIGFDEAVCAVTILEANA